MSVRDNNAKYNAHEIRNEMLSGLGIRYVFL